MSDKPRTSAAVKNKWNRANYDRVEAFFPKGQKDVIKSHAASMGESVNGFISRAVSETMERDAATASGAAPASTLPGGGVLEDFDRQ